MRRTLRPLPHGVISHQGIFKRIYPFQKIIPLWATRHIKRKPARGAYSSPAHHLASGHHCHKVSGKSSNLFVSLQSCRKNNCELRIQNAGAIFTFWDIILHLCLWKKNVCERNRRGPCLSLCILQSECQIYMWPSHLFAGGNVRTQIKRSQSGRDQGQYQVNFGKGEIQI